MIYILRIYFGICFIYGFAKITCYLGTKILEYIQKVIRTKTL